MAVALLTRLLTHQAVLVKAQDGIASSKGGTRDEAYSAGWRDARSPIKERKPRTARLSLYGIGSAGKSGAVRKAARFT